MARQYRRDSRGRFAGSGTPGAKVTSGRAGGFANANHRARVQEAKKAGQLNGKLAARSVQRKSAGAHSMLKRTVERNAGTIGLVAGVAAVSAVQGAGRRKQANANARNASELATLGRAINNLRTEVQFYGNTGKPLK